MAEYNKTSPYSETSQTRGYLDVMTWRPIPAEVDDILFKIGRAHV